uniref:acetylglutamate kinase n=1 Tax=Paenibacillus sp. FSL R7-0345 TaxID=2954535 RepID=UPI00406D0EFB
MYAYGGVSPYAASNAHGNSHCFPAYYGPQLVCLTHAQVEFKNLMRTLWEQHVAWTRMAITSLVFGLPDTDVVVARLLQNPVDMGNAIRPFYGDAAANTYTALIKEHLVIAADLIKAAKAGDSAAAAAAEKRWYANADQIVEFLTRLNPYFPKEQFRKMFYQHLAMTKEEAVTMLNKDYTASIRLYDRIEQEALMMADILWRYLYVC